MGCIASIRLKRIQRETELPMEFIKRLDKYFKGNVPGGKMDRNAFVNFFGKGHSAKNPFLLQMFRVFDRADKGWVDFEQIATKIGKIMLQSMPYKLRQIFHMCDDDNSGSITRDELAKTFKNLAYFANSTEQEMENASNELFDLIDTDKNGSICQDEFKVGATGDDSSNLVFTAINSAFRSIIHDVVWPPGENSHDRSATRI